MIIYKITNLINNKIYIGLTTRDLDKRISEHKYLSKNSNYAIHRAMRKYGIENFTFETIDQCDNIDDLINLEFKYIIANDSMNPTKGYNMMAQNDSVKYLNEETKKKIGIANSKKYKTKTPEEKMIISFNLSNAIQGRYMKNKTSKYVGVRKIRNGSYNFTIICREKSYSKNFKDEIDCAKAYDIFAIYLFGENAKINFEDKREYYISLDLESVVDKIITTHSFGRKGRKGYLFYDLPVKTKPIAIKNVTAFIDGKIINDELSELLINITFHYNGEIFLNSSKYSDLEEFIK